MISLFYSPVHSRDAAEKRVRRPVGEAKSQLVRFINRKGSASKPEQRQALWEAFHKALLTAAERGFEDPTLWHSLATHTLDPKIRFEIFTRTLASADSDLYRLRPSTDPLFEWTTHHLYADSLLELARLHLKEGRTAAARECLERATPLAQKANRLRDLAHIIQDDPLSEQISDLLNHLPT